MSTRNLKSLFEPASVAIIGASQRPHSVGATVLRNMTEGNFKDAVFPVNPKYGQIGSHKVYARVADLPQAPDLAVICTPPSTVPGLIRELGARGTKAAVVITAGLGATRDEQGITLKQAMLNEAKPHLLRILGPNCVGLLAPGIGLNASFAHTDALPGRLAFVSQSGALMTAVLDWAKSRGIGFSKFISLGESADVDFGDVLDYLAGDGSTQAILMYIEDIRQARKFMSAARAAARSKPVIVVKAGRAPEGAKAAASHTGALAGADDVYDAAIRRAGMLRVFSTEELFDAVETLARSRLPSGDRLVIMTNGGGPGVMATDDLIGSTGHLAKLSEETLDKLDEVLPAIWSRANPVDIIGDAAAERYVQALEILLKDPQADAILCIHAPTAIVSSTVIAEAIVPLARNTSRSIITCWLGGDAVVPARQCFAAAGIPAYDTPEDAVGGFMQVVQYRRNQNLLMQVPPSAPADFVPDRGKARTTVRAALEEGRTMLSEPEAKAILSAYGVPVVETRIAHDIEATVQCARHIGFPVALKILSPDITHKSDVGGVVLDLESEEAVRAAGTRMHRQLARLQPGARLTGFTVQAMARRPQAHELIIGITTDPVFGPVILFGQGGVAVEVMADHAIALPPLNMVLAHDLVSRTRVAKLLAGYRNQPPADLDGICRTLIQISHLITDIAEIAELDINPLLADSRGVIALDARIRVAAPASATTGADRFAIRPYPEEWEELVTWQDKPLLLRPIRPEDGASHLEFFHALTLEDVHYRAFIGIRELQPSQLARLTQIDYDREMAFVATRQREGGGTETIGVARAIADPDNVNAEFAVIVRSDLKGKGLGKMLMKKLIDYCCARGTKEMVGEALGDNKALLNMVRGLGFQVRPDPESGTMLLRLDLAACGRVA
ncbi:GNAT family N-acetyltransferase [Noviherbaspirillum massiliense]|uniref:bifunctional acetate--CoA ligase family protein/GNAT family N-acetyltransferase n=1 Tax=Noviherbaspirillum massiliense TaxID=1465823 RepID=UPI00031E3B4B|nr:GNAT family N-acetyltransferase [Noviherbaspirillum massiliense]